MAIPKTDRKAGAAGRHKAARPLQRGQVGTRASEPRRGPNESRMAFRRPVNIEDEPLLARSDRPRISDSDDDAFGGSER